VPQTSGIGKHGPRRDARQHAVVYYENSVYLAVRRSLRDASQLIKKEMRRTVALYGYLGLITTAVLAANIAAWPYDQRSPDSIATVVFLGLGAAALNLASVRIERGRLTLTALLVGAAALVTNPLDATLIGLVSQVPQSRSTGWRIATNSILYATEACAGSLVAAALNNGEVLGLGPRVLALAALTVTNWLTVAVALAIRSGEPIPSIIHHNFTTSFYVAFAYFGLCALVLSYLLDGSPTGYLLASIVCVLALALTDTIAGRRVRRVLESELSDADRHLFHSRAVEGVVHNLRNHVATAVGYLKEIEPHRLDPVDRESLETATAAANDAVTVLRSLAQGATPRVSYALEPVDLNELVTRALGMARPRARTKEVQLAMRESPEDVRVRVDPLLMREVITNLMNNAVDAAPPGGHVNATTGRRSGRPYLSVADNGPGISDEHRHRLFEPHFTTKEGGTGLGLFMSYGIVREHQGQLLFEGTRRGAVFTVVLPPYAG
jgi:signal transduction histidine kinase